MSHYVVPERLTLIRQAYGHLPVVVFQAPAGCGKTSAAEWWVSQSDRPVVWMRLASETALQQDWTFLQALNVVAARAAGWEPLGGLLSITASLDEVRRAYPGGVTIVCEDWHLASGVDPQALLTAMGTAAGDGFDLIVTTRTALDLPDLSAWQVRRHALLITDDDLRLSEADVGQLLEVGTEAARQAYERTHGWPFAVMALAGAYRLGLPPDQWQGGAIVANYWRQHVLGHCPPELIAFVEATAVLESFTVQDCTALGLPDADRCLQRLLADRLFLRQHDDRFSYHELARQAVMAGMGPGERRERYLAASRALWQRHDQGCLPGFLAAGADDEAARAIAWFFITVWRETTLDMPVLRHWFGRLPADTLSDNPWYLLLYAWLHMTSAPPATLVSILDRAAAAFVRAGETDGATMALLSRCRWHNILGDTPGWQRTCQRLTRLVQDGDVPHALSLPVISSLVRYYGLAACDPDAMEHWLDQARQHLPTSPAATALLFDIHLTAAEAYVAFGESRPARENWTRALELRPRLLGYDVMTTGIGPLVDMVSSQPDPSPPLTIAWPETMARERDFHLAETAWAQQDYDRAEPLYRQAVAPQDQGPSILLGTGPQLAWTRLSLLRWRRGDLPGALDALQQAKGHAGAPHSECLLKWHEALVLGSSGQVAAAMPILAGVMAEAEARHFTFHWVLASLLQAHLHDAAPPVEVRQVIDLWDYGPALARHYPELPIGPGEPPRVVIRTLGGLHVTVYGAPIVWKRTNAQILLLDLLIHPEGSTGEELLQRYWPLGDLATLRKDVLTLRQALEPDSPGRQSRYVTLRQGVYRLTQDPGLIGWDVAALRVISRHGLRAARHPQQRARLAAMLADLQGPFVPEFAAYAPLAAFGAKAQSQQDALAAACLGSCRTP